MITTKDIATARTATPSDVCFTARVLAGQIISYLEENPRAEAVRVPHVCINCLEEAVPTMVELATGKTPQYVWDDDLAHLSHESRFKDEIAGDKPKVGILGNALHCFDPMMNDDLGNLLVELGCMPVFPEAQALCSDNVQYKDQLQRFCDLGVRDVIYIQSFGCTKANVHVRGQLHSLRAEFPDMYITVIDYDPDSSKLNRENRIRLAVEAASKR